jgi:hypothetical protein
MGKSWRSLSADQRKRFIPVFTSFLEDAYLNKVQNYQAQVRLKPDGTMANYRCGQPFNNAELKVATLRRGLRQAGTGTRNGCRTGSRNLM